MQAIVFVDELQHLMKKVNKKPLLFYYLDYLNKCRFKKILFLVSDILKKVDTLIYKYKKLKVKYVFKNHSLKLKYSQKFLKKSFFLLEGSYIYKTNYNLYAKHKSSLLLQDEDTKHKIYYFPKNQNNYILNDVFTIEEFLNVNGIEENQLEINTTKGITIDLDDEKIASILRNNIFHLHFNNYSMEETIDEIELTIKKQQKSLVVPVNLDMLRISYKDLEFRRIINEADITLIDGKPLIWFSKLYRKKFKHKVSGSDLIYPLLEMMNREKLNLFIVGGKDQVAEEACKKVREKYPEIMIAGHYSPPFGFEKDVKETQRTISIINEANPQVVLLCLGAPKQEKFYKRNCNNLISATYVCAGATVDFLAGNVRRAPQWMSSLGLEWLYRLCKEPKRLFKRYWLDFWFIPKIMFLRIFKKELK
ncbi:MAG: WecB/TagA/CpsF family glycosyltransferase [Roseburia sp.]|nr:WecB/TagA/CpsF family glycosyltransferase [Anaeroplasma bactoclasticum]MCM1196269.1 WecB/TagA/CpsF family glycosyltransferase [Roseburia sp.]MCM1557376.1 WecB/TagA/CpsF family glycosyltransferase [Anaeroplasma bactoclasticum]